MKVFPNMESRMLGICKRPRNKDSKIIAIDVRLLRKTSANWCCRHICPWLRQTYRLKIPGRGARTEVIVRLAREKRIRGASEEKRPCPLMMASSGVRLAKMLLYPRSDDVPRCQVTHAPLLWSSRFRFSAAAPS